MRACVGRDALGTGNCRFAPVVTVAGDPACAYHLVSVVKLRLSEVRGGRVVVEAIKGGRWERRRS